MATQAERRERTRGRILDAARRRFREHGYDQTSMDAIRDDAEVSKGALYHHFPTKEALFEAVFEESELELGQRLMAEAATSASPLGQLRAGCDAWLEAMTDPATRQVSLVDAPAVLGWQRWREIDAKYGFGLVKMALQGAMDSGEIPPQPVDTLAHLILAALGEAAMLSVAAGDPDRTLAEARVAFRRMLDALTGASAGA